MLVKMPAVMTSAVSTPAQQATFPWVTQTPEQSPMLWGRFPVHEGYQPEMPSKQLLRTICEPFFEQMLVAVHQAVQEQSQQTAQIPTPCRDQVPYAGLCQPNKEPRPEEGSNIVHDSGFPTICHPQENAAFSTLFGFGSSSSVATEEESSVRSGSSQKLCLGGAFKLKADAQKKANVESPDVQCSGDAEAQYQELVSESPQRCDKQKTVTVCRHWKSKGFCRMQDQCKFLHPEHKCGVGSLGRTAGGENISHIISNSLVLANDMSDEQAVTSIDVKKRRAKNRKSKGKAVISDDSLSVAEKGRQCS